MSYRPKSLLAAILFLSVAALFFGTLIGNRALIATSIPFILVAGGLALAFILLALARNFRRLR